MKIMAFGITKDIIGGSSYELPGSLPSTVEELKRQLEFQFPAIKSLSSVAIAVNSKFAEPDQILHPNDEIALIPPVSGG